MKVDTALLKGGVFWAAVVIAWMAIATIAYHYSRVAGAVVWIGWIVFLCLLFGRIPPRAR